MQRTCRLRAIAVFLPRSRSIAGPEDVSRTPLHSAGLLTDPSGGAGRNGTGCRVPRVDPLDRGSSGEQGLRRWPDPSGRCRKESAGTVVHRGPTDSVGGAGMGSGRTSPGPAGPVAEWRLPYRLLGKGARAKVNVGG